MSFLRLLFTSLSFSLYSFLALFFNLSDLAPSIVFFSFLLSSIFLQLSVLIQLSTPQYIQCRFSVGGLNLLPPLLCVVGWVRLLTVLVVIGIHVVLVWCLEDAESIPQVELELLSDLGYSQFTLLVPCSPHLLVLFNLSFALVMTRLWSLPTSAPLHTLVSWTDLLNWDLTATRSIWFRWRPSWEVHVYVAVQNEIQVKMILTLFDSQFPLSSDPNYS